MKRALYLAFFLAVIGALSGALLSFTYSLTQPVIDQQMVKKEEANLIKIFPNADFKQVDFKGEKGSLIQGVYEATGEGYVFKIKSQGYKDNIEYMIGISTDGKITGYEVLAIAETSGIGTKVAEAPFKDSVVGKDVEDKIDTISGATVSSTAVIKGINEAVEYYEANLQGGK